MPHNHGHDVRDEHRNTENFAKGVENAPNDNAQQGLDTAQENSGISAGETFYLNDKNGDFNGSLGYTATDGPDIFVYDFSQTDGINDTFEINDFNASEDTLIFINAEVPFSAPFDEFDLTEEFTYFDFEATLENGPLQATLYEIISPVAIPSNPDYQTDIVKFTDPIQTIELDSITVYEDAGATLASVNLLNYQEDTTDPTPSDTFAHVYEGDPFADGLLVA